MEKEDNPNLPGTSSSSVCQFIQDKIDSLDATIKLIEEQIRRSKPPVHASDSVTCTPKVTVVPDEYYGKSNILY